MSNRTIPAAIVRRMRERRALLAAAAPAGVSARHDPRVHAAQEIDAEVARFAAAHGVAESVLWRAVAG